MTNDEWIARLGTFPPQHRVLAEALMERITTVLNGYAQRQLDDAERIERLEREIAEVRGLQRTI